MPTLADSLNKKSVHRLHEAFQNGVLELEPTDSGDIGLHKQSFEKVGIPIIRWVHYRLMSGARPNPDKEFGFPYRSEVTVSQIFDEEGIEREGDKYKRRHPRLLGDITRIMQRSGIALHRGKYWYLKPWDESQVEYYSYGQRLTVDEKTEKRVEEESDQPVNSKIDLRSIQVPDEITPETIMNFVERFVPAALKVQDKYELVHKDLQEAHQAIANLEAELEGKAEKEEWQGVGSKISDLLGK